jgi:DNA-binding beta-propeller fold protein YncE
MGIAISDAGEVFVADLGNHRVQVFNRDGEFQRSWGDVGGAPGQLFNPIVLQIGPQGNIWVVDYGNNRVQTFTVTGDPVSVWNDVVTGPQIISLNADGHFFVSTPGTNQVRHFSPDGEFVGYLGLGISPLDSLRLLEEERTALAPLGQLAEPHDTATDSTGAMYLADTRNNVVRKFIPVEVAE